GGRIGAVGQLVGLAHAGSHGHAAGIGVLDDHAGLALELPHALQRAVGVGDVVERELLALREARAGDAVWRGLRVAVERGLLVRVLAVAQRGDAREAHAELGGEAVHAVLPAQPVGYQR